MKNLFLSLVIGFITLSLFAQSTEKPQLFKYVSTAPDGSVNFTVIDDSRKPNITIESVHDFYKYQLVDLNTGDIVFTSRNKGKVGSIDKLKLRAGDYNILIYTKSFIIGSEITVKSANSKGQALAMAAEDND
ncbi:MAG: hypothetical protein HKN90_05270 [Flavobacteriaceae bacterium]|nr:hypothetical protein [Flavobacteriaceae bacterium]